MKKLTHILKRIWNYTWKFILFFLIVANLYILITGNFYLYRAVYYTFFQGQISPGIFDKDYFYSREIKNSEAQLWPVSAEYNKHTIVKTERKKLEALNTTSYLVFRNDTLVYEEYFENFGQKETSNSFSMAKSVVGLLIGIVKDEGKIKSIDDPVSDYLPNYDKGNRKRITIRHLLTMSADLVWNESAWNPLSHNAEAYYGTDLNEMMGLVEYGAAPEKIFDYKSGSTQVLGMIVMKVTGKTLSEYASEKLWKKIGAEDKAYWSLDHEKGVEKAFCCLYATSRDYARLGKLMMHHGKWNGEQIIDSAYVAECIKPAKLKTTDGLENSTYGLTWWINKHKGLDVFYARGIKGQYVICIPSKKLMVVRTGHNRGKKRADDTPEELFLLIDIALSIK